MLVEASCMSLYALLLLFLEVPNNKQIYPLMNLELMSWTALSFAAIKGHVNVCQVRSEDVHATI